MDGTIYNHISPHTDLPSMLCLIFVYQIHQEKPENQKNCVFSSYLIFKSMHLNIYLQVIGKVVFIKSVGLKAMRRRVKVVTSDATYEALCLHRNQQ